MQLHTDGLDDVDELHGYLCRRHHDTNTQDHARPDVRRYLRFH